jgi:nucleoside-diphosphate-sugar epimerase
MGLSNAQAEAGKLTMSPGAHHNRALVMAPSSLYLVTGGAGFIGSHVVERLLSQGHRVRALDNFSTGSRANLDFAKGHRRLEIIRGDLKTLATVERAVHGVAAVFHQAAMRSVPRSVADPLGAHASNVTGTLHVFVAAARQRKRPRVVYASSSSVYGERPDLPKREDQSTAPISPYAVTKVAGELYASVWSRLFGVETVGLRYFNVFGPRQDPKSEYAAVIPRFILWGRQGKSLQVHGDGTQSRDFTYIDNVVSANLLAAAAPAAAVSGKSYNIGCGSRTSLLEIIASLEGLLGRALTAKHLPTRVGDVPHTLADISAAKRDMGYGPLVDFDEGLRRTVGYFTEGTR